MYLTAALTMIGARTSALAAQREPASGAIDGIVTDTTLAPLADASASILASNIKVTTGAIGRFVINSLPAGEYVVLVRRVGYAAASQVLQVNEHDTLRVSFTLQRAVTTFAPVLVAATHVSPRMAEFEARRKSSEGQFMTDADIAKLNFATTADVLRTFKSIVVGSTVLNARTLPTYSCPMQFFIDGVAVPQPGNMDIDLPAPNELAGIEVYVNSAAVPLQYKTYGGNGGFCGVVLIWTKS
jgi:uncharacterized membrane protein